MNLLQLFCYSRRRAKALNKALLEEIPSVDDSSWKPINPSFCGSGKSDTWESHQALTLEGSREAYNPHQAVYLIVVV
jgi:hypothetical protein